MKHNKEISIVDFYDLFLEFEKFTDNNHIHSKVHEIINEAMSIINKLTFINSSTIYFINQETFDLTKRYENCKQNLYSIDNYYDQLINEGVFGNALQSCKVAILNIDRFNEILVIPLLTIDGVIGLLVINCNINVDKIKINILSLIKVITSSMTNMIHSYNLRESHKNDEDLVEQTIAIRTKKLVENQQVLGEKIEKMKSNLSMALPHEFRTPINQIHGFSNYLVNHFTDKGGEDYQDIIEIVCDIKESATRLKNTFENYLYYANLFIVTANINDILELQKQTTFYCETVIFENAMNIAYKYNRSEDLEIYALEHSLGIGEEHFTKIIQELTDNCFKFSEIGTKVIISTNIDYDFYNISFLDNGIGLKTDDIENIDGYIQFERMRNEQQGLGLGLSIVRKILDIYNAEIVFASEPYKYTKITISIPISYAVLDLD